MNIDKLAADASKLSIPQLQQAMRDGTLPPYVGLPILQQKSQLAKQAQAAQAAGQPRPPTVAEQVDGEASQAQSVQDLMKQRALAMQGEMAGTGGLGSFVREPEKKMALGGAVAFNGETGSYVSDRLKYIKEHGLLGTPYEAAKQAYGWSSDLADAAMDPETYSDMYAAAKEGYGDLDSFTKAVLYGVPEQKKPAPVSTQAPTPITPIQRNAAAVLAGNAVPQTQMLNTAAQSDNRDMASRMQLGAPQTDNVATKYGTTVPAGGIAQSPAVQQEPAQERKSLADYRKEYMDLAGPNQNLADLKSFLAKQGEEYTEDKKRAPWMALMQAGLATMAGTSPFALANIGAGGMKGLEAYGETQKDLKKAQDRQFDLQAKIGAAQRAEDLAALNYGTDSVKFDKAEASKERLQDKHDETLKDIAKMNNQADIQRANITASMYGGGGKGTDEQHTVNDLLKAMEDPKAYPQLRGANGAPDILKVRQAASIASGTNKQTPVMSSADINKMYTEYQKDNINRSIYKLPPRSFNEFIDQHPNKAHMLTSQDQDINSLVYSILGKQ